MTEREQKEMERVALSEWIEENKRELDGQIDHLCPNIGPIDEEMRRLWVLNCEDLYNWARSSGVEI